MINCSNIMKGSSFGLPFFIGFLFLLLVAASQGRAQDETHSARAPIKLDDEGRLLVDVDVAGRGVYPFLLDTGADRTVVYRTLTTLAELEAVPRKSRRVWTSTGRREMQLYQLEYVRALGVKLPVGETVALPDPRTRGVLGILGVDLLRGKTLQIEGAKARLLDAPEIGNEDEWTLLKGWPVGRGSIAVTVRIAGRDIPAFVDTGAGTSVMNRPAYDVIREELGEDLRIGTATVRAAGGRMVGRQIRLPKMRVGDWERVDQELVVADLPVFTFWGARSVPAMIIGADILFSNAGMIMDFYRWELHIRQ